MKKVSIIKYLGILLIAMSSTAFAEKEPVNLQRAEGEELAAAVGHYARARSLIIAAVREFDKGHKRANPQALIDVKEFRHSLLDRAEDLEKILAPQPRSTEKGVQFSPDSRLLSEAYQ